MIFCFSGTGNSRIVADHLQNALGDEILRLPPGLMLHPEKVRQTVKDGRIIWVFPVHGWNLPHVTRRVISEAEITSKEPVKHYMVCTCGDDIGNTHLQWRKLIEARGWQACSAFSVQMPNIYVMLKGFDVDSPDVTQAKLNAMPERVANIADFILCHPDEVKDDVVRGSCPWLKTAVLYPLFRAFFFDHKKFGSTDACIGCGLCARNCPIQNITIENGRPAWREECIMCLRCYHVCPRHAIRWNGQGGKKGQYIAPGYTLIK